MHTKLVLVLLSTVSTLSQAAQGGFQLIQKKAVVALPANDTELAYYSDEPSVGHRLAKRAGYQGRATWYKAGLGACGWWNNSDQPIVALGQNIWDTKDDGSGNPNNNGWCGQWININYAGRTEQAQIVDLCPYSGGCSAADGAALDMTESLFGKFADLGAGIFYMSWSVAGSSGGSDDGAAQRQAQAEASSRSAASAYAASQSSSRSAASVASVQSVQSVRSVASVASAASVASVSAASVARQERLASISEASAARAAAANTASADLPVSSTRTNVAVQVQEDGAIQAVNDAVLNLAGVMSTVVQVVQ